MLSRDDTDLVLSQTLSIFTAGERNVFRNSTVDAAGLSHRGYVRENNEDHFVVTRFGRFLEVIDTNLAPEETPRRHELVGHGLLVADGLGGHASGEAASAMAIQVLLKLVVETADWILRVDDDKNSEEVARRTTERLDKINQAMSDRAAKDPSLRGFATTMTIAWGLGAHWFVANIGDSRAYLCRGEKLIQLTKDHTLAQQLADQDVIPHEAVANHRWRHRLTAILGDQNHGASPEVQQIFLQDGDQLLLCSDGLTEMVDGEAIRKTLTTPATARENCSHLVQQALAGGGKDNVTVAVAKLRLPAESPTTIEK